MFSGIIQATASIASLEVLEEGARICLPAPENFPKLEPGASVAVDGVCLTLENDDPQKLQFFVGAETNRLLSWADRYQEGQKVNLETSLKLGDPVDGHFVTGHVDSLAKLVRREEAGGSLFLDIELKPELSQLVWKKGSIALNGVSLTINEITDSTISICLIPETRKRTNLNDKKVGDFIHAEPDVLARVVERQIGSYLKLRQGGEP